MKVYGNWCGPNWSDGRDVPSVHGFAPAIDETDETCRQHDFGYADNKEEEADWQFFTDNFGTTFGRSIAAIGVYGYNVGRRALSAPDNNNMTKRPSLRGSSQPAKKRKTESSEAKRAVKARRTKEGMVFAPSAIGTVMSAVVPVISHKGTKCTIEGRDYVCSVGESNSANYTQGCCAPIHPAYFSNTSLGNLARAYEKYRFRKVAFHFITRNPTSSSGEVILATTKEVTSPSLDTRNSSFLARVMSNGNAVMAPIWQNLSMEFDCDDLWRLCDPLTSTDIDDQICGEVQVYTQGAAAQVAGYVVMSYHLEFDTPIFQLHSTSIPVLTGPSTAVVLTDTANEVANNAFEVNGGTFSSAYANGTIWKFHVNLGTTTFAGALTAANSLQLTTDYSVNTTTGSSTATTFTITDGMTWYLVVVGNNMYGYVSLEQAVSGSSSGQLYYNTGTAATATWGGNLYQIRAGNTILPLMQ